MTDQPASRFAAQGRGAHYDFTTRWWFPGEDAHAIRAILADAQALPRWWPSVYLEVRRQGDTVHLHTKGWLPYTLRWSFRVTHEDEQGFSLRAQGDLAGQGQWILESRAGGTLITYRWSVQARHPLIRRLSRLLRPLFAANHHWAMRQGERSLRLELARQRGEAVPPPPGPTFRRIRRSGAIPP